MKLVRNLCLGLALLLPGALWAQNTQPIRVGLLIVDHPPILPVSRLDLEPEDLGAAGADLAIGDNNTTGRFLGQSFELVTERAAPEAAVETLETMIGEGVDFVAVMAEAETLIELADAAGEGVLLFNVTAGDNVLRNARCRGNVLHIAPSRAMLTDALIQFLVWKKWDDLSMIHGSHPADMAYAENLAASARKFGTRIGETLIYEDTGGARQTDSGHVQVQRQMPLFTQDLDEGDVLLIADESEVFGDYVPFQTWRPTLVAGTAGLTPTTWHPALEAWGAAQLQRRFEELANRTMRPEDYQAWLAVRVLGEAATRTGSTETETLRDFILGEEFEVAGFKGQALSFRSWNGQMRQPILLAHDNLVVSVSPQEGFLHQVSLLDTMGLDAAESNCTAFTGGTE